MVLQFELGGAVTEWYIMHNVVQNATQPKKSLRGRPPSFDADAVVAEAVNVFWRCGYQAASLAQLEHELGVNRSTLYNSFGGKEGLFQAAVEAYLAGVESELLGPLRDGNRGIDDLIDFLERQRLPLTDPDLPAGCLLVNAMVTGDAPEATRQYVQNFRDSIEVALQRAAELGEVSSQDRPAQTSTFLSAVLGTNLAAKSGIPVAVLHELIDGLSATVRSWSN